MEAQKKQLLRELKELGQLNFNLVQYNKNLLSKLQGTLTEIEEITQQLQQHPDYMEMLREFHEMAELTANKSPTLLDQKTFELRKRLHEEEHQEFLTAVKDRDIVEIADALGDLLYVVFGTAVAYGLNMDEIFKQIHTSNMTKRGGKKDKGGKFIKPDTYKPVDLNWVKEQGE